MERNCAVTEREDVIRERLANRYRKTYQDRVRNYSLRESEIFAFTKGAAQEERQELVS